MCKGRRARIAAAVGDLQKAMDILKICMDEEEASYNGLPYSVQQSRPGQDMVDNIATLLESTTALGEMIDTLQGKFGAWGSGKGETDA